MNTSSKIIAFVVIGLLVAIGFNRVNAYPSVYPTGTTIYDPEKAWNGYVVFGLPSNSGAILIDMNGNEIRRWDGVNVEPEPMRILPGGYVVGSATQREGHQEAKALVQLDWDGNVLWDWLASDHVDEMGLSEDMRNVIHRADDFNEKRGSFDWLHINAMAYIGPNKWYDEGDDRFNPENIILSIRRPNVIAIVDRSGSVVWRMGPDYRLSEAWSEIGQMIGHHHPHIIPFLQSLR